MFAHVCVRAGLRVSTVLMSLCLFNVVPVFQCPFSFSLPCFCYLVCNCFVFFLCAFLCVCVFV